MPEQANETNGTSRKLSSVISTIPALLTAAIPLAEQHIGLGFLAVGGAILLTWYYLKRQGDLDGR